MPWWRHLVSDCEVKSRTLAPSVWQHTPSALNLLFLSCVTGVWVCTYDHCMLVEQFVLTEIKTIIIIITLERRRRQVSAGRQLDDVPESTSQLFTQWRVSVLLRRTSGHSLWPRSWIDLRCLHHTGVSTLHYSLSEVYSLKFAQIPYLL